MRIMEKRSYTETEINEYGYEEQETESSLISEMPSCKKIKLHHEYIGRDDDSTSDDSYLADLESEATETASEADEPCCENEDYLTDSDRAFGSLMKKYYGQVPFSSRCSVRCESYKELGLLRTPPRNLDDFVQVYNISDFTEEDDCDVNITEARDLFK